MSNLNGYNDGIDLSSTGFDDIKRPMETYDGLIRFVEAFPLRLVIVIIGLSFLLQLAGWRDTLSGDAMMQATLGYIIGFFVVLGEAAFGKVTRIIKDIILRIIIRAEENSAQL